MWTILATSVSGKPGTEIDDHEKCAGELSSKLVRLQAPNSPELCKAFYAEMEKLIPQDIEWYEREKSLYGKHLSFYKVAIIGDRFDVFSRSCNESEILRNTYPEYFAALCVMVQLRRLDRLEIPSGPEHCKDFKEELQKIVSDQVECTKNVQISIDEDYSLFLDEKHLDSKLMLFGVHCKKEVKELDEIFEEYQDSE